MEAGNRLTRKSKFKIKIIVIGSETIIFNLTISLRDINNFDDYFYFVAATIVYSNSLIEQQYLSIFDFKF